MYLIHSLTFIVPVPSFVTLVYVKIDIVNNLIKPFSSNDLLLNVLPIEIRLYCNLMLMTNENQLVIINIRTVTYYLTKVVKK